MFHPLHVLRDPSPILSPSLLIYRELVRSNLAAMIASAGSAERLRPHVKTHKMAEIVRMCEGYGIKKFKCATIAEAEMVAAAQGQDVLVSYPLVGPNIARLIHLIRGYRHSIFRVTVDHPDAARALAEAAAGVERPIPVLLDLDVGMGRTGIDPGQSAEELYALVDQLPNLAVDGLHAYDGQVRDGDPEARAASARPGQMRVFELADRLARRGLPVNRLVLGGSPTYPIHARLEDPRVECSPGTVVFYDTGYAQKFSDLPYTPAALLLTRVISLPRSDRVCLDLGHKAVAADPAGPRVLVQGLEDAVVVNHSEEHLVLQTPRASSLAIGQALLAIPTHVCPTVALHRRAYVVEDGVVVAQWDVSARDRLLGV